jgi:hypothetical protein
VIRLRDRIAVMDAADLSDDGHGNPVADWANAPSITEPANVTPLTGSSQGSENIAAQNVVISRYKMLLLPATTVDPESRVQWRGDTYEVVSDVLLSVDHANRPHHRVAYIERVQG